MKKLILALCSVLWLLSSSALATEVTFQQGVSGYTGSCGFEVDSANTNMNLAHDGVGINATFNKGVLYFDLSSIPSTATINTATLYVKITESSSCTAETVIFRKVLDPDASGDPYCPASAGTTFNTYADYLYKNDDTNLKWDSGGGSSNITDVNSDDTYDETMAIPGCAGEQEKSVVITDMVQYWVTNPASNAGMVFGCTNTCGAYFVSTYDATTEDHPRLVIDYTDAGGGSSRRRPPIVSVY